jgi:hypothetical protein
MRWQFTPTGEIRGFGGNCLTVAGDDADATPMLRNVRRHLQPAVADARRQPHALLGRTMPGYPGPVHKRPEPRCKSGSARTCPRKYGSCPEPASDQMLAERSPGTGNSSSHRRPSWPPACPDQNPGDGHDAVVTIRACSPELARRPERTGWARQAHLLIRAEFPSGGNVALRINERGPPSCRPRCRDIEEWTSRFAHRP